MTPTLPDKPSKLFVIVALSLAACSSKAPATERGVQLDPNRVRKAEPVAEEEPEEPEPENTAPRRKLKSPFDQLGPGDLMAEPGTTPPPAPAPEEPEGEARDLGRELSDLLRQTSCLDLAVAARQPGGRQTISGTAYVMASGRITRATVSASGQPSSALRCAESRLVAQGLRGPVPGGAQSISGSTTIEVVAEAPRPNQQPQAAQQASTQAPAQTPSPYGGAAPNTAAPTSNYGLQGVQPDEMAGAP
jgi:hypothetical protein